jgi:hypothetical protein
LAAIFPAVGAGTERRRELADIAGVIEVHVTEDHIIDVGRLDPDLRELEVDRDVRTAADAERLRERPPIATKAKMGGTYESCHLEASDERGRRCRCLPFAHRGGVRGLAGRYAALRLFLGLGAPGQVDDAKRRRPCQDCGPGSLLSDQAPERQRTVRQRQQRPDYYRPELATVVYQRDEIINAFWPKPGYGMGYITGDFAMLRNDVGQANPARQR